MSPPERSEERRGVRAFVEFYEVRPPYQAVGIAVEEGRHVYVAIEPKLSDEERKDLEGIKEVLLYMEDRVPLEALRDRKTREEYLRRVVKEVVSKRRFKAAAKVIDKITYSVSYTHLTLPTN